MKKKIGELIREYRERNNLTLSLLGSSLRNRNCVIDSDEIISNWETGIHKPDIEIIEALSIIFRMDKTEKEDFFKVAGYPFGDERQETMQHDEKIFRDIDAAFTEDDLRELINMIYSEYQFKASQLNKLTKLINYLAQESNRFIKPELVEQKNKLGIYLDNFYDFLKSNFHQGTQTDDSNITYFLTMPDTGFETESFLIEFQMIALDIENAFRKYRAAVSSILHLSPR